MRSQIECKNRKNSFPKNHTKGNNKDKEGKKTGLAKN